MPKSDADRLEQKNRTAISTASCNQSSKSGERRQLMRQHDGHLDMAARSQDLKRHLVAVAANPKINARRSQSEVTQHHVVEERRQARVTQPNLAALGVEFKPKRRLQQCERCRALPCLRCAGDGIERRPASLFTPKAAEQFR